MKFIETKHTMARMNKIQNDLGRVGYVVGIIGILSFLAYYTYLAIENARETFYLIVYSCLAALIFAFFCVEVFLRKQKKLPTHKQRLRTEKKRKYETAIKWMKYVAKAALVGVALYETATNFSITLSNAVNICSAIFLVLQILLDFIIRYVVKQMEYFKLSFNLDCSESASFVKSLIKEQTEEAKLAELKGEEYYSPQQKKMMQTLIEDAENYKKRRDEEDKQRRDETKQITQEKRQKNRQKRREVAATALSNMKEKVVGFFKRKK